MGKLFDSQNSFKYIDRVQDLVNNYNNTIYTTIKMKPIDAIRLKNYDLLTNNYYENYNNIVNKINFEVGDVVRIPIYLSKFTKEMTGKWTS